MIPQAKAKSRFRAFIALGCAAALSTAGAGLASAATNTPDSSTQQDWRCQVQKDNPAVTECQFDYTGAPAWWTVPAGVTSVDVRLFGAQGGESSSAPGGSGGYTRATLAVTPLTRYQVTVGGSGTSKSGGYNGGGGGWYGGGGGATDVRINGFQLTDRIIVAGGGGGASDGGQGGDGAGQDGDKGSPSRAGGGGATWYQPGMGGKGSPDGQDGDFGKGGYGSWYGGGGGGGWYGGGGGADSSGGGGGSGFVDKRFAEKVQTAMGIQDGDGVAIIRYPTPAN